jgi:hypothetical protein
MFPPDLFLFESGWIIVLKTQAVKANPDFSGCERELTETGYYLIVEKVRRVACGEIADLF